MKRNLANIKKFACPCCENTLFIEHDEQSGKSFVYALNPKIDEKVETEQTTEREKEKENDGNNGSHSGGNGESEKPKTSDDFLFG